MSLEQGAGRREVPWLEEEHGSDHGGCHFPFKAPAASLLLQEKCSELI